VAPRVPSARPYSEGVDSTAPDATPTTTAARPVVGATRDPSDRWEWRRRIRADPRKRRLYRAAVAVVGGLMVLAGVATGWLPGPGGIPLVLGGLAVLASEFSWARRLLARARVHVHAFTHWAGSKPLWVRWAGSAGAVVLVLGAVYLWLVVLGTPGLLPDGLTATLVRLPGVEA